jgi:hypothetical protein
MEDFFFILCHINPNITIMAVLQQSVCIPKKIDNSIGQVGVPMMKNVLPADVQRKNAYVRVNY